MLAAGGGAIAARQIACHAMERGHKPMIGALVSTDQPGRQERTARTRTNRLSHDDWRLIQACKRGDRAAWNKLIARYEKSVYKFAYTLARNYDDAADIAGQVFVRLYENIHTFRNDSHFTSWLFCIVRNVYVDTCVRPQHRSHLSLDDGLEIDGDRLAREVVDSAPTPLEATIAKEKQQVLRRAIRHLPQYQRKMMEMYHAEGRSYEEIAKETGLSLGTVKSRLSRARQMLRERLAPMQEVLMAA
jgi:RNA polymerase sigma-70 factor (ECF subfamily)